MVLRFFLALALLLALPVATPARDLVDDEYAHVTGLIVEARPTAARAYLDSLAADCAGEPLYLLTVARLQVEDISIDDMDKEGTRERSRPALDNLQRVVDVCDARLEAGGDELRLRFLRGWAWMLRSQVHAIGRSFWSAGREAGRGKEDLDFWLAAYPDEPVANGLLGAFLYFTDAVPDIIQLLSKLVRMPAGDRERGLAMIDRAVAQPGAKYTDYLQLQSNVNIFFEGRFETGLPQALDLHERYPAYTRNALAPVAMRLWAPASQARIQAVLTTTRSVVAGRDSADIDWSSLRTAEAYDAWADRFLLGAEVARPRLEVLAAHADADPAWVGAFARLQLAQMAAEEGDFKGAASWAEPVRDDPVYREPARDLLKALEHNPEADPLPPALVAAVHGAAPDSLAAVVADLDALASSSLRAAFYAAECRLRLGEMGAARRGFQDTAGRDAPPWLLPYRMLAATRVADLNAAAGRMRSASRWLERAMESFQEEYRVDWMLKGRARWFAELHGRGARLPEEAVLTIGD